MALSWLESLYNRGRVAPRDPSRDYPSPQVPLYFVTEELRLSPEEQISISAVWAAIRQIVDPIASSEVHVITKDKVGVRTCMPDDALAWILNRRANPDLTAQAFKEILLTETLLTGNGYAEIVKDMAGRVVELWPIPSDLVKVQRDSTGLVYLVTEQDGTQKTLAASEVIHVRGPSLRGFLGDSLVYRAAKAIALAAAQDRFAAAYYANNTVMGGVIEFPTVLNPDTKKRMADDWKAKYGGRKKAHSIAVLEGGAKFTQFNVDADKSQLVPSRTFSVEEVARYFGVPLVRLGVQAAAQGYGTNVAQLNLQFVRDTLTPWVNRLCEEVAHKCYPQRQPWRDLEIDLTWLTLGDSLQRAQSYEVLIRTGVKTVNECRAIEGDNGIGPEGDLHLIGSGLTILDEENLSKPEPVEPADPTDPAAEDAETPEEDAQDTKPESAQEDQEDLLNALAIPLTRFQKRLTNRAKDLRKGTHTEEAIAAHLAEEAAAQAPAVVAEVSAILKLAKRPLDAAAVNSALSAISEGFDAKRVASSLVLNESHALQRP